MLVKFGSCVKICACMKSVGVAVIHQMLYHIVQTLYSLGSTGVCRCSATEHAYMGPYHLKKFCSMNSNDILIYFVFNFYDSLLISQKIFNWWIKTKVPQASMKVL